MRWIGDGALDHLREVVDEPDLSGTRYRLLGRVGRGGMGTVYRVEDTALGREVAMKVSALSGVGLDERLVRESGILAGLEHPGIVPVHDAGRLPDGRAWYVMKLVRGERLDHWAAGRDRATVLRLFLRVCEAVGFAHAHGVLHRDLKPDNVMVGEFGEALVLDWGVARRVGVDGPDGEGPAGDADPEATVAGTVIGTPGWMSPEQERGEVDRLDGRCDVYGLGALLQYLLAGRPPRAAAVPRPLASICAKALAPERDRRYAGATDLADDIARWLDGLPVQAHQESPVERLLRFAARHRVLLSLLAAYLLVRVMLALAAR